MTGLLARPVVGFRRWRVGTARRLWPAGWVPEWSEPDPSWPPGRDHRAACRRGAGVGRPGTHEAPDWSCGCGLHAMYHVRSVLVASGEVRGAIVAWGRIIMHETGFRAEHARIVAFAAGTPPEIAERYDCPVLATDELVEYAGWFGDKIEGEVLDRA